MFQSIFMFYVLTQGNQPGTTFAWGDPIHVVETKHISLIGQHLNRTSSSSGPPIPQPLLLSKYAIDL